MESGREVTMTESATVPLRLARWQRVQELFEQLRTRPSHEWHAQLSIHTDDDPTIVYEVLSLLVAAESAGEERGTS